MRFFLLIFCLITTLAQASCPLPIPPDNAGLSAIIESSAEIIVVARSENDPCLLKNFSKGYGESYSGGRVGPIVEDITPFTAGQACPGLRRQEQRASGRVIETCTVENPRVISVDPGAASFSMPPDTDVLVVDIKDEDGGKLSERFSIPKSDIYDAQKNYTIATCLPANCRAYFFRNFNGGDLLLTITTGKDGKTRTRFIVNTREESAISSLPPAEDELRRRQEYRERNLLDVYEALGDGHHRNYRRCYEPIED